MSLNNVELVRVYGRCTCPSDGCDAEGDPGCAYCQHIDPEWPCPHDPEVEWDFIASEG